MSDTIHDPAPEVTEPRRWTPAVGLGERLFMLAALTLPMWVLATDLTGFIICAIWQTLLTVMCVGAIIRDTKDGARW
jgi:hypothetical protein